MKSTYKILSVNLDGLPLAKNVPVDVWSTIDDNLFGIEAEYNLFDYPHCRRVMLVSVLLSVDLKKLSLKVRQLHVLEELVIKIDYISPLAVTNRLLLMRVLQAAGQLQQWHPDIKIVISVKISELDKIKPIFAQLLLADSYT